MLHPNAQRLIDKALKELPADVVQSIYDNSNDLQKIIETLSKTDLDLNLYLDVPVDRIRQTNFLGSRIFYYFEERNKSQTQLT